MLARIVCELSSSKMCVFVAHLTWCGFYDQQNQRLAALPVEVEKLLDKKAARVSHGLLIKALQYEHVRMRHKQVWCCRVVTCGPSLAGLHPPFARCCVLVIQFTQLDTVLFITCVALGTFFVSDVMVRAVLTSVAQPRPAFFPPPPLTPCVLVHDCALACGRFVSCRRVSVAPPPVRPVSTSLSPRWCSACTPCFRCVLFGCVVLPLHVARSFVAAIVVGTTFCFLFCFGWCLLFSCCGACCAVGVLENKTPHQAVSRAVMSRCLCS